MLVSKELNIEPATDITAERGAALNKRKKRN